MTIAVLTDEDSSGEELVSVLRSAGLDVATVYEVGLARTQDATILEWAAQASRAVVTANKLDSLRLALEWAEAGRSHAGIVIRYPTQAPEVLAARAIAAELLGREECRDTVLWAKAV